MLSDYPAGSISIYVWWGKAAGGFTSYQKVGTLSGFDADAIEGRVTVTYVDGSSLTWVDGRRLDSCSRWQFIK